MAYEQWVGLWPLAGRSKLRKENLKKAKQLRNVQKERTRLWSRKLKLLEKSKKKNRWIILKARNNKVMNSLKRKNRRRSLPNRSWRKRLGRSKRDATSKRTKRSANSNFQRKKSSSRKICWTDSTKKGSTSGTSSTRARSKQPNAKRYSKDY
jgi:hypothetical protein